MEANDPHHTNFNSYFLNPTPTAPAANSGLSPLSINPTSATHVYPSHSVGPAVVTSAPVERRKRGRPRKYGTPELALAAKKDRSIASNNLPKEIKCNNNKKSELSGVSLPRSGNSHQPTSLGYVGQGFAPHVINVAAGEDVCQKLMLFLQQSKREMCILSASGSISNVSLLQPATSGGSVTYEGRFEIISLSGSYVRTDLGEKAGGLSICLSTADSQIIGGGIGGPLKAAGPVQVIVGAFSLGHKKDAVTGGLKGNMSASKLPPPAGGATTSSIGFHSPVESLGRNSIQGNDKHPNMEGSPYMVHHQSMFVTPSRPTNWGDDPDVRTIDSYDFSGRIGHGAHNSPENGDYEQLAD